MRRSLLLLALLVIAIASPVRPAAAACPVDTLAWMAGSWSSMRDGIREEEHWMAPRASVMVGMNRIVSGKQLRSFEFFRIEAQDDGVYYMSSPGGQPATPFKLIECGPARVVFENPTHDFPQRIISHRTHPDTLRARIEGTIRGALHSSEWAWTRGALAP